MKRRILWKLSVSTSEEAEEAVAELVAAWFGQPASTYTDLETGQTTVTTYLETKPDWSTAARGRFNGALKQIKGFGSKSGRAKVRLAKLRPENWAEAWKRYFKPLEIGAKLLIKPSWSRRPPKRGQVTVVLDPGMSFGTGQHPTTSYCLSELARWRQPGRAQPFLDIGTGSGILALAAAKLGYGPIEAFDLDRDAIKVAGANAQRNKVSELIRFQCQDISTLPPGSRMQYSVVCANLISNLLLAERECILGRLEKGGLLVLAGILTIEFTQVQAVYEAAGLRLVNSREKREWRSGSFLR